MKTFEKVDGGKLLPTATFTSDLGLDSLDAVEVVMAIEEEFGIEIPDAEADEITTVQQAVDYIAKTPERGRYLQYGDQLDPTHQPSRQGSSCQMVHHHVAQGKTQDHKRCHAACSGETNKDV